MNLQPFILIDINRIFINRIGKENIAGLIFIGVIIYYFVIDKKKSLTFSLGHFTYLLMLYTKFVIENKQSADEEEFIIAKQNIAKMFGPDIVKKFQYIFDLKDDFLKEIKKYTPKIAYEDRLTIFAICCQLYIFQNIENAQKDGFLSKVAQMLEVKADYKVIFDKYLNEEKQHQQRIEDAKRAYENYKHLLASRDDSTFYYEVLGLSKDATEKQISRRFRELAVKYHPDKYSTESEEEQKKATEKFKEIADAYNYLKDKLN